MVADPRGFPDVRRRPGPDHQRMIAILALAAAGMLIPLLLLSAADRRSATS
jgi:hypothetical protein